MPKKEIEEIKIPLPGKPWFTSREFAKALRDAALMHAGKRRKGTQVPYVAHLIGTCSIAFEYGADEEQAIAALFHDAVEDLKPKDEVRAKVGSYGGEVLRIVEACSDSDTHPKPPWRERKERYIAHLAKADSAVLLVSMSDKLYNARSIVAAFRAVGPKVWNRFSVPREQTLWYYRELVKTFRGNPAHHKALADELDRAVTEMERL